MAETTVERPKSSISDTILQQFRKLSKEIEDAPLAKYRGEKRKAESDNSNGNVPRHCGLSEADVFITEYISKTSGFSGILKHRFSDFQVNEIDLEGNVVELTSCELPQEKPKEPLSEDFKSVLTEEQWTTIDEIMESDDASKILEIDVTEKTKAERGAIHSAIKNICGVKVFSNTIEKDGKKFLQVKKCNKKYDRICWPQGRGKFLHFSLHKENVDVTEAVNWLAKALRIRANNVSYAGTKDKRAKTTQRMCVKLREAEMLAKQKFRQITIGNYSYEHKPLYLGQLAGNRFRVAIRDVKGEEEDIAKSMDSLKENGFVNYFGLQRFGSSASVPTYAVGKALLSTDWKLAVELILKPREGERCLRDLKKAREVWWETKNPALAIKCLPKFDRSIEGKLFHTLKTQGPKSFSNAIFAIPRNTLMLYVHSYQSLIWNKIVSRRIKEFGLKPIAGDLVIDETQTNTEDDDEPQDDVPSEDEEEQPPNQNSETNGTPNQEKLDSEDGDYKKPVVKVLTEEEAEVTPIEKIVYPLPGHDVKYPENEIAKWYTHALQEDNLAPENFKSSHKVLSVWGSYRQMIGSVGDLEWRTVGYNSVSHDLILSDLDKMNNVQLPETPQDCQYKAVIMEFSLKPSTYATMVLREVMKCETSGSHHAALTIANHSDPSSDKSKKIKTTDMSS